MDTQNIYGSNTSSLAILLIYTNVGSICFSCFWGPLTVGISLSREPGMQVTLWVLVAECFIILMLWTDLLMQIFHLRTDVSRTWVERYIKDIKIPLKLIIRIWYTVDFLVFHASFPALIVRFSTIARPSKSLNWGIDAYWLPIVDLIMHSGELKKTVEGILRSVSQVWNTLLFFLLFSLLYALLGVRVIGSNQEIDDYDIYVSNFRDLGHAMNSIFLVLTGSEGYPSVMRPAFEQSPYYLFYFLPFLGLSIFLLKPVPVAIFFNAFRVTGSR